MRAHNGQRAGLFSGDKKLAMAAEKEPPSAGISLGLALILAIVLGGMYESFAGFATGALLGVLAGQVMNLRTRIRLLDEQLQTLRRTAKPGKAPEAAQASERDVVQVEAVRQPETPRRVAEPAASPQEQPRSQPAPAPAPSQPAMPQAPREPSPFDRLAAQFVAWLKRGNPVARIGIVILFLGALFLAKYAADNSLFPIELRFLAIAGGAFVLLIIGWRLRDARAVYAQLLQGGGIAGLYLTIYAATKLYQLLPFGLALALMIVIAVAAAMLAVAQNALSLAVIGTAGGFLAPVLVSTGSGNHVALFTYYAVLNLGVFVVAWFRTWRVLNVLGFVFTFTITGLWRATGYQPEDLFSADAFLILFFLLYVAISILNCLRQAPDLKGYVSGSLVFGLPIVAFSLHATLVAKIEFALAWSALALGAFYLILGWTLLRTRRESFRLLVEAFAALGVIFASLAIPLAFDTRTTAAMWAVEGAGLLWLGVRQNRKLARAFGSLLQAGAGVGFLLGFGHTHAVHPVLNSAYLGALMLGVSGLFSSYWLHRNQERQASYEVGASTVFALWGTAWWLFGGLHEIERFVAWAVLGGTLGYAALTAMLLTAIGIKLRWSLPQTIALHLPALAGVFCLAYSVDVSHPFAEWGALGWLLLFAAHYTMLYLLDAKRSQANEFGANALHAGAYWVLALLVAWEVSWQVEFHAAGVWPTLAWGVAPALFLALVSRRRPMPTWPLSRFIGVYRMLGAVPLAVAICAWIAVVNLTNSGDPMWLPYIPLLNPLDISVALCLAALALWWTSLDEQQRASLWQADTRGLIALIAAIVFIWLNAALIRSLHHNWGAPITLHGIVRSTFVQAALSIFWGVLGFVAMTIAAKQRWRYAWMVGGSLMIVVVIKLFLVDLSSIGTIARIASFLSVGALLLVTGYLAPLPPKRAGEGVEG
jgi:uncharacterized membrane protein